MKDFLINRRRWDAHKLISGCKPKLFHPNKTLLYEVAFASGIPSSGTIGYSRWKPRPLPASFPARASPLLIARKPGFFDYVASNQPNFADWHLNFANYDAYSTWADSLFAQDEMQVAEHPGLMALRMKAERDGLSLLCVEHAEPTPVLVTGIERRLSVDTTPNADRPSGLYGKQFHYASQQQIKAATTVFNAPSKSNLIAIEAPPYGVGFYSEMQIAYILRTALAGFAAARDETLVSLDATDICIQTGFWGCGAYGGNRVLMTFLQIAAADLAGVGQIVFHVGDSGGEIAFDEALTTYSSFRLDPAMSTPSLIQALVECRYEWGASDGN